LRRQSNPADGERRPELRAVHFSRDMPTIRARRFDGPSTLARQSQVGLPHGYNCTPAQVHVQAIPFSSCLIIYASGD
jgi:hypothetical protein